MPATVGRRPHLPPALSTGRRSSTAGPSERYRLGSAMPPPPRAEVVVVGAGLAGLSAAARLEAAGCDVHVLESRPPPAAGCSTERIDGFVGRPGLPGAQHRLSPGRRSGPGTALELGLLLARRRAVRVDGRAHRVVDPRRHPGHGARHAARAAGGRVRERAALVRVLPLRAGYSPGRPAASRPPRAPARAGAAGRGRRAEPRSEKFLAACSSPACCWRTGSRRPPAGTSTCCWRSFVRGAAGLPAARHAGDRRAAGRPARPRRLHLRTPVSAVAGRRR